MVAGWKTWSAVLLSAAACAAPSGGTDVDAGLSWDASADAGLPWDAGADGGAPVLGALGPVELHDALVNKDFLLIDVHVPYAGVVPGTDRSIAYTDVDGLVAYLGPDLDRKVVLTCLSGHMSGIAGAALVARGYRRISQLTGGMNAWVAAGYTLQP